MPCPLCHAASNPLLIATLAHTHVVLGDNQGCPGWCVCVLREHVEHMDELPIQVQQAIFGEVATVARAIRAWTVAHGHEHGLPRDAAPPRINYECLGNQVAHIHWHVIPRHADDPDPRNPVWGWPKERLAGAMTPERRAIAARQLSERLGRSGGVAK
jgi:diadenosine tetraphosphate (Ap4A) HIT family hydrolase